MADVTGAAVETTAAAETTTSTESLTVDTNKEGLNNGLQTEEEGRQGRQEGRQELDAKLEKLVQAEADRRAQAMGKTIADLNAKIDKMQKESMTAEEIQQLEISQKEQELLDKEKLILEKENRLFIVEAVKKAGLDDGQDYVLDFYDLVYADTQEQITENVDKLKNAIDKRVAVEVDKTFKHNGTTPKGAQNGAQGSNAEDNSIAATLGKRTAAQNAQTNDVLNQYLGGNK